MPRYKIELRVKAEQNTKTVREIVENMCMDMGLDITSLTVSEARRRGRPSGAAAKVTYWIENRHKEFEAGTFEKFTGLSKPAAWHRLNRLVAAGVYKKKTGPLGEVIYYRPDNRVGE